MWTSLFEQHFDDAEFLFEDRTRMLQSLQFTLGDLRESDERLQAHLAGLRIGGKDAWRVCQEHLESGEEAASFVAAHVALSSADGQADEYWDALLAADPVPEGFVWAMGLDDTAGVQARLEHLMADAAPHLQAAALRSLTLRGRRCGADLQALLSSASPDLAAAAAEHAGHFHDRSCEAKLVELMGSSDSTLVDAALEALFVIRGDAAILRARKLCRSGEPGLTSIRMIGIGGDPKDIDLLAAFAVEGDPIRAREALLALGSLGDPGVMPVLQRALAINSHPHIVGVSLRRLFGPGVDLSIKDKLPLETDEDHEELEWTEDDELPLPDERMIEAWWNEHRSRFPAGRRVRNGDTFRPELPTEDTLLGFRHCEAMEHARSLSEGTLLETRSWSR